MSGCSVSPNKVDLETGSSCMGCTEEGSASEGKSNGTDEVEDGTEADSDAGTDSEATSQSTAECSPLPPLPTLSPNQAEHWLTLPEVTGSLGFLPPEGRLRVRGNFVYVAAGPKPLAFDFSRHQLCRYASFLDPDYRVVDVHPLSIDDSLIVLFGKTSSPRKIRVYSQEGEQFVDAVQPEHPSHLGSTPSAFVAVPSQASLQERLFVTYGGPALDFSVDGGHNFRNVIASSGSAPAQGLAIDRVGKTLWYISELAPGRVASLQLPLADIDSQPQWHTEVWEDWGIHPVLTAETDPHRDYGIYIGSSGRLARLDIDSDGAISTEILWMGTMGNDYGKISSIWPDPLIPEALLFGGSSREGPILMHRSSEGQVKRIPFPEDALGSVRGIALAPDGKAWIIAVMSQKGPLSLYVLGRNPAP